jgi:hypothetical protein
LEEKTMNSLSKITEVLKEDVNSEESLIAEGMNCLLNGWFKLILFLGIPYLGYLLLVSSG